MARWGWGCWCGCLAAFVGLVLGSLARPAHGQQMRTIIESRERVFPAVGPGVTALKRDSEGRYYLVAEPATVISIYDSDGKLTGQIPNAKSQGATIKYAVDIDISPDGLLFVADRGTNAVEVFKLDSSFVAKVSVVAPTSVVALSDGQFAVTSLASRRLVQIRDIQGNFVRSFGDPTDVEDNAKPMMDMGRITGDSTDHIYFAFTSVADPTLRTYDRYGYVGYAAKIPESAFAGAVTRPDDRVQFSLDVSRFSLADRTSGSVTLGSSGDVNFNGGMGTGLMGTMRPGGGFGRGGMGQGMGMGPDPAGMPGGMGGGTLAGMFSGQITDQGSQFHFGLGKMPGSRGGGQARNGGGSYSGQTSSQGGVLQFLTSGNDTDTDFTPPDLTDAFSSSAQQSANADSEDGPFANVNLGVQSANDVGAAGQSNPAQGFGLPTGFVVASLFNSFGFRPPGASGGFAYDTHAGSASAGSSGAGTFHRSMSGPTGVGSEGYGHFGPHGHFGPGETNLTASVRVNIGDLGGNAEGRPVITAVGVDPVTHEIWAGIGDTLVHFSKTGDPLEMYLLTIKGGAPLKAKAVLVEPGRILIAADPRGVFEFARPDMPVQEAPQRFNVVPEPVAPQR